MRCSSLAASGRIVRLGPGAAPAGWRAQAACSRRAGYGLLTVCSASKVNATTDVSALEGVSASSGSVTRKHSTSLSPPARKRSPAFWPWTALPNAAPSSVRCRRRVDGAVEVVAAAVAVLGLDLEVELVAERGRGGGRHRVAEVLDVPAFVTSRSSVTSRRASCR